MRRFRILVTDDEPGMLEVCEDTLSTVADVDISVEADPYRALARLREEAFDLLITDIQMPGMSGVELLEQGQAIDPDLVAVMITAYPSVDSAVAAMRHGAVDYVTKPFHPDELRHAVQRLLEFRRLRAENELLRRQVSRIGDDEGLIADSAAMHEVLARVARVAEADVDVLVTGETGTGKELVARMIHQESRRAEGRFVAVNCGAIPKDLLESECFGYERGAFTGADRRGIGLLEYAHGGTIFLDEIGELPLAMQTKLLRVLQERKIRRVGGREEIPVDVRVLAATSRDLQAAVRAGQFRDDLWYRINVVTIALPPLRARREDIPLLAEAFFRRYRVDSARRIESLDPAVIAALEAHDWPGNVRELQNAIRHCLAFASGPSVQLQDLPGDLVETRAAGATAEQPFRVAKQAVVDRFERRYLEDVLRKHGGNVRAAAKNAGVPRGSFYRLLEKHAIDPDVYR